MIKKLIAGGLMAAVAAVAVLLVTAGGTTATAAVNSVAAAPATINAGAGNTSVLTIDADEGQGDLRILTTSGTIVVDVAPTLTSCTGGTVACAGETGSGTADVTIPDAGNDIDTVLVHLAAPATGPATATVTVIQGTSSKTTSVVIRGNASKVEIVALNAESTQAAACQGTPVQVINSSTATAANGGAAFASLCARVKDSQNNYLVGQPVIFSTTAGTLDSITAVTGPTGQYARWDANAPAGIAYTVGSGDQAPRLTAGTTGTSGTTATVTASSGGVWETTTVKFGGDPASCAVSVADGTIQPGASAAVTIEVKDSADGPVPDGVGVGLVQANASVGGAGAAVVGAASATTNGLSTGTVIAATAGPVALGATAPLQPLLGPAVSTPISCTGTLIVAGSVVPPGGTPGEGSGLIDGEIAANGTSLVGWGGGTTEELVAAVNEQVDADSCSIHATVGGKFVTYVPGASIAAVNANWMSKFSAGVDVPAVIVTC